MILVSACLLGHRVKYNGGHNLQELLSRYNARGHFLAVCPECLGMLPVPRLPMEIYGGTGEMVLSGEAQVKNLRGETATSNFTYGASRVLDTVHAYGIQVAILKESSPSCGVHSIYDGTFSEARVEGHGVCAALLAAHGVTLYSEKDLTAVLLEKLLADDIGI